MKITNKMCFIQLSWLQRQGEFLRAVSSVKYDQPAFEYEGMAGYIEVNVEFQIKDITLFAKVWNDWYSVDHNYKSNIRNQLLNGSKCVNS